MCTADYRPDEELGNLLSDPQAGSHAHYGLLQLTPPLVCMLLPVYQSLAQVCGYSGPVFMTHPTRAIAPIMLHDFYR